MEEERFQSGKFEGSLACDTQAAGCSFLDSAVLSRKQAASLARWGWTSRLGSEEERSGLAAAQ